MLARGLAGFARGAMPRVQRVCTARRIGYAVGAMGKAEIVAAELAGGNAVDKAGFPRETAWDAAQPIRFAADWRGENSDEARATEVRALWSDSALYLKFVCRYRTLTVWPDSEPDGRRDLLWDRDVAEVFLQPPGYALRHYWEYEVSPNGMWIDLEILADGKHDAQSGMKSRVRVNQAQEIWTAEIVLPLRVMATAFDPKESWRVNFFRVEGEREPRFYASWQATLTPQPNFHVPDKFATLRFAPAAK